MGQPGGQGGAVAEHLLHLALQVAHRPGLVVLGEVLLLVAGVLRRVVGLRLLEVELRLLQEAGDRLLDLPEAAGLGGLPVPVWRSAARLEGPVPALAERPGVLAVHPVLLVLLGELVGLPVGQLEGLLAGQLVEEGLGHLLLAVLVVLLRLQARGEESREEELLEELLRLHRPLLLDLLLLLERLVLLHLLRLLLRVGLGDLLGEGAGLVRRLPVASASCASFRAGVFSTVTVITSAC